MRTWLAVLIGSALVLVPPNLTASGPTKPTSTAPRIGGHLTIAGEAEVGNPWTPAALNCDSYCFVRARTFFDSIAAFGADGAVHGVLAESIEPNADYTEWTIRIREGISFTDGTPVNADAVIYNLQAGAAGAVTGAFLKDIAKIPDPERPDELRLKIEKFDEMTFVVYTGDDGDPARPLPWRSFPHLLTGQWGLIASPRWLEAVADDPTLTTQPVGSGPFIVESFEPRASLELSRNPDYWMTDAAGNRLPYLDSLTFRVIEDSETSVEALQADEIDMISTSNGVAITRVEELGPEYSVTAQAGYLESLHLLIDLDKSGPLQDRRVRCALSLAIDRREFNEVTADGFDVVANGPFSPGQQGYLPDNGLPVDQDLERARAMIAEYESETGREVEVTLGHTPTNVFALAGELLIGWWEEIGVDVRELTRPQDDYISLALVGAPEFEVFLWREHAGVVLDEQYIWWHSELAAPDGEASLNIGRLRDPAIDAALDAARAARSDRQVVAAAEEINRIIARECYSVPLTWVPWAVLSDADVEGLDEVKVPDGTGLVDPAGINGQFWVHTLHLGGA